jgi:membrane-associated phospholipid phosphatase
MPGRAILVFSGCIVLSCLIPALLQAQDSFQEPASSNDGARAKHPETEPDPDQADIYRSLAGTESPKRLSLGLLEDQKDIWTSPFHLRFSDTQWLVPFAGITAGLAVTDRDVSAHISSDPNRAQHYRTLANGGVAAFAGIAGGLWLAGTIHHDEHQKETGLLSGQAAVNSVIVVEAMKYIFGRERPNVGDGRGAFFKGGSSFPSTHAAVAWSVAGILAHEYPGPLTKALAYGLATAVSISRIQSRDHFPSDVLVSTGIGMLIAHQVYHQHHDTELPGANWRSIGEIVRDHKPQDLSDRGSPYVPLDSWIYEAFNRLMAMRIVSSGIVGMRPWTRSECARLLIEANDAASEAEQNAEVRGLVRSLRSEFAPELGSEPAGGLRVESVYSRAEHISGLPLRNGYNFGQTQINDFGRPYGPGWSTVNGFATYATRDRWIVYFRSEWQTAESLPALSLSARQAIQTANFFPAVPPATPGPSFNRFAVLDAYVGLMLSDWQLSFGRQSLWLGTTEGGPMLASNNAPPITMFRIDRVRPMKLPSFFGLLGPVRMQFFLGQVDGHQFVNGPQGVSGSFSTFIHPQPMIDGYTFSFKPTSDFEFGFGYTTMFAGQGVPFTLNSFARSLFSLSNGPPGSPTDAGDRRSSVNWSYRLWKLRDWVTFYGDAFSEDEPTPLAYPHRSAIHAGLYLARLPRLQKLDLRAEGVYTDPPRSGPVGHGFFYSNTRFLNGYTNDGQLIANWIGRQGQGAQAWTNYWFNSRSRLQLSFRHQKVSNQLLAGGGSLSDFGLRGDFWTHSGVGISGWVQHERWLFPVIQSNANKDVSVGIQLSFEPRRMFGGRPVGAAVSPGAPVSVRGAGEP